jgi:DNA-directed RNA polymerase specialized sigma24 family protein
MSVSGIPKDVEREVCSDYLSRMNSTEIARKHGISKSSVGNILKRNGIATRTHYERCAERDQQVIEDYLAGATEEKTGERFGISQTGVGKILHRHGIRARFRLTDEEKDRAVSLYVNDEWSTRKIASQLGVNYTAICSLLKARGIERRSRRIWHFDESYFARTDDRVAYWMGFIMADGNIFKVRNTWQFTVAIQQGDRELLEKLCDELELSNDVLRIREGKGKATPQVALQLCHPSFQDWFLKWGIVPRKSYNFVEPTIPVELYPSFLRGWFDGDGHLRVREKTSTVEVRIAGSKDGMTWYAQALRHLGFRGNLLVRLHQAKSGTCHYLIITGESRVVEFYKLLRARDALRLSRKWTPLELAIEKRKQQAQADLDSETEIVEAYKRGRTEIGLAREFHMGTKRVREVLLKAGLPVNRRRSPIKVSGESEKAIVSGYLTGFKQDEIAEKHGLTQARVSSILRKHNIVTIPSHIRRMIPIETSKAIAAAYEKGLSEAQVAAEFNLSVSGVHKALKRENVTMRLARRYKRKSV